MPQTRGPRTPNWYRRLFAFLMARGAAAYERRIAPRKRALFEAAGGDVLEIGPGAGPNLRYYPESVHWVGIEPNPYMHQYLVGAAAEHGLPVEIRTGTADALPAGDESVDTVVSTLVLCSVPDMDRALAEIGRVLRPGGRFLFVEHVAAPEGTSLRHVQHAIQPLWSVIGDGCHPDRETGRAIEAAGFAHVEIARFDMPYPIVRPHIAGVAVK